MALKPLSEDGQAVIDFWFKELKPAQWWRADSRIDQTITQRFAKLHQAAARGELLHWRIHAEGSLAEIIVLDQFSRNLYRNSPQAYALDSMALALAQQAIASNLQETLPPEKKAFMYMPYMHSESRHIHELAVVLFREPGLGENLSSALRHKAVIDQFGRYPHRNAILNRPSSPEEIDFLKLPGSSF